MLPLYLTIYACCSDDLRGRNLVEVLGDLWSDMRIEFVTYFREDGVFRVVAKSSGSFTLARWQKIAELMSGVQLEQPVVSRYATPLTSFAGQTVVMKIDVNVRLAHFLPFARLACFLPIFADCQCVILKGRQGERRAESRHRSQPRCLAVSLL